MGYLLRIREPDDIPAHAMKGAIFETFVVSELYKAFSHRGELPPLYFWRDQTGHEVDVIIDTGKKLVPIEVRAGETVVGSSFEGLRFFTSFGPPASSQGVMVYGGEDLYQREDFLIRPWFQCF